MSGKLKPGDNRQSIGKITSVINKLQEYSVEISSYHPLLSNIEGDFGIQTIRDINGIESIDCITKMVTHTAYK